jgi:crotonobetainyl-CoA:carnitine CoA-transferase CaiB-like acyl-CoA transferase
MAYPSTWSATQPSASRLAPRLGEHSIEILRELDYDEDQIAALVQDSVTKTTT